MADTKISGLSAVTDVQTTDEFVMARAGTTKKITGADLAAEIGGGGGGGGGTTELAYGQWNGSSPSSPVSVTTGSSPHLIVTAPSITADGTTPILIEFFAPIIGGPSGNSMWFRVFEDGSDIGTICYYGAVGNVEGFGQLRLTPTAGAHVYDIRAYVSGSTGSVYAGPGGAGNYNAAFIRITSVVGSTSGSLAIFDDITLASPATSIDFTSIPGGYTSLWCQFILRAVDVAGRRLYIRFNNDSGGNYAYIWKDISTAGDTNTGAVAQAQIDAGNLDNGGNASGMFGGGEFKIPFYDGATIRKTLTGQATSVDSGTSGYNGMSLVNGSWNSTAAITRVTLVCSSGNFAAGSRAVLYGVG